MHQSTSIIKYLLLGLMSIFVWSFTGLGEYISSAEAQSKTKERVISRSFRGGHLFVSDQAFPTKAESLSEFIRNGRKFHRKVFTWSKGTDLSVQFLLVLPKAMRLNYVHIVLFRKGKGAYVDAQTIPVEDGRLQLLVSKLSFTSGLQKGGQYELRAVQVERRGRTRIETILASTHFRLK
jgi:hypothetical protein